jgi:MraZ protein
MFFAGTHDLTLDPKNRLSIPAQIRAGLDPAVEGTNFYVVPGKQETMLTTLYLFPEKYFERYADEMSRQQRPGRAQEDWELIFFAHATLMEVDKQGRVLLPQWAVNKAGLRKHVKLTGARNRLVLWDRDSFEKFTEQNWSRQSDWKDQATPAGSGESSN